jgi:hypothetical protein
MVNPAAEGGVASSLSTVLPDALENEGVVSLDGLVRPRTVVWFRVRVGTGTVLTVSPPGEPPG